MSCYLWNGNFWMATRKSQMLRTRDFPAVVTADAKGLCFVGGRSQDWDERLRSQSSAPGSKKAPKSVITF